MKRASSETDSINMHIGKVFFDAGKTYKYVSPYDLAKQITTKQEVKSCPLCGSGKYLQIGKFEIDALIETWVDRFGFNPFPDVYRHDFLTKLYCTHCGLYFYNYHIPDSADLYERLEKAVPYYPTFRWEHCEAMRVILDSGAKSLLEIGCGEGDFLVKLGNVIPNIVGSEYNHKAARIAKNKGLQIMTDDVADISQKFDAICHFEVLEHVRDTKTLMKNCIKLLNKNGLLLIGTPDPEGILSVNGIGPLNLPPHHQFDFSYKTFEYLAKLYSLEIYKYSKSELDYRQYEKYVENITGKKLTSPDVAGFQQTAERFPGHSHFVAFRIV
jgi:2-polyprenyl-3-methyl-5-hydroxy-6-metoxy-1,4-benzoquinol methylase